MTLLQSHDMADHDAEIRKSEKALAKLEASCESIMDRLERQVASEGVTRLNSITDDAPLDFTVNVFHGDSLVWWNDIQLEWSPSDSATGIRFIQNGWYQIFYRDVGVERIYGLLRLRSEYPYNNRFLTNAFHPALNICNRWTIAQPGDTGVVVLTHSVEAETAGLAVAEAPSPRSAGSRDPDSATRRLHIAALRAVAQCVIHQHQRQHGF